MERGGFAVLVAVAALAGILAATVELYRPPDPAPIDAARGVFSASRARETLRELIGDGEPRPAGTAANARVRDALVARFEALGYATELQESFACGGWGGCASVANVLAWQPGRQEEEAVLLMAHYDSVAAGPGAADNGSGIAILLESARVLADEPPPRHPILFLVTDGEEMGLLGAEVFLSDHPRASLVAAVINVEARGSGGSSLMFETGPGNAGTIRHFAAVARRPVTSSLFDAIYQRLPNDTDFTPFKARGLPGLNFAFVGHPLRYHTRQDRLAHLDTGSLQQQGTNALAAARALAASDLARLPRGEAVFFDLLGRTVVWWPVVWNWAIAAAALLLLAAAAGRWWRSGRLRLPQLLGGVASVVTVPGLAWAAALAMASLARRTGASPGTWVANPLPLVLAFWLAALAVATLAAIVAAGRAGARGRRRDAAAEPGRAERHPGPDRTGLWAGIWIVWGLTALFLAAVAPGAAYLFSLPALAAALATLPGLRYSRSPGAGASVLPSLVAAILWFPILWFLYEGMGLPIMPSVAALVALVLWGLAPVFPRGRARGLWGLPVAAGAAGLLCLGLAMARPPYTPDQPRALNLLFVQDADSGEALWAAGASGEPLPAALAEAAGFSESVAQPLPWVPRFDAYVTAAPPLAAEPPELALLSDRIEGDRRRLRGRLRSSRGARSVALALPPEVPIESVRVAGRRVPGRRAKTALGEGPEWRRIEIWAPATEGVEIDLVIGSHERLPIVLLDESADQPAAGRPLLNARPPNASPIGRGDRSIVFRRIGL